LRGGKKRSRRKKKIKGVTGGELPLLLAKGGGGETRSGCAMDAGGRKGRTVGRVKSKKLQRTSRGKPRSKEGKAFKKEVGRGKRKRRKKSDVAENYRPRRTVDYTGVIGGKRVKAGSLQEKSYRKKTWGHADQSWSRPGVDVPCGDAEKNGKPPQEEENANEKITAKRDPPASPVS